MKNKNAYIKIFLIVILASMLIGALVGCNFLGNKLLKLSINGESSIEMTVGEKRQLSLTKGPSTANESVLFFTDNEEVVSVSSKGELRAVDDGKAVITAQTNDGRLKDSVIVHAKYESIEKLVLETEGELIQHKNSNGATSIKLSLSHGDIEVPKEREIIWHIKEIGDSDYKELSNFNGSLSGMITPKEEIGYCAFIYAEMKYSGMTFRTNTIYYGYFERYQRQFLTIEHTSPSVGFAEVDGTLSSFDILGIDYNFVEAGDLINLTIKSTISGTNQFPICEWKYYCSNAPFSTSNLNLSTTKWEKIDNPSKLLNFNPKGSNLYYAIKVVCDGTEAYKPLCFKTTPASVKGLTLVDSLGNESALQHISNVCPVTLMADWNKENTAKSEYLMWYLNDVLIKEGALSDEMSSYIFTPKAEVGTFAIKVVVYDSMGSENKLEKEYVLKVKDTLLAVREVALNLTNGKSDQTKGTYSPVTLTASAIKPVMANDNLPVYWYVNGNLVNDLEGYTVDDNAKTLTFTPSHGENSVFAEMGNVRSNRQRIYCFTSGEWNEVSSYCEDTFEWEGDTFNYYLSSHLDTAIAFSYLMVTYSGLKSFYFDNTLGYSQSNFEGICNQVLTKYYSGGSIALSYGISGNILELGSTDAVIKEPSTSSLQEQTNYNYTNESNVDVRYNMGEARDSLPIDDNKKTFAVTTTDALWRAVSFGYVPTMAAGTSVETVYNQARAVALKICTNTMSDTEKVLAICDWLADNVVYDYGAVNANLPSSEALTYACYYLEGVFGQGLAVCDGISKAFVLLCGLENIKAIRVVGTSRGVNHAWNKALLDPTDSGIASWYAFDVTWANVKIVSNENEKIGTETYFHEYLFMSEIEMANEHDEKIIKYQYTASNGETKTIDIDIYPDATNVGRNIYSLLPYSVDTTYLKGNYDNSFVSGTMAIGDGKISNATELAIALIYSYLLSLERGKDIYVLVRCDGFLFADTTVDAQKFNEALSLINIESFDYELYYRNSNGDWLIKALH